MSTCQYLLDEFGALIGEALELDESGVALLESDGQLLALAPARLPDGDERMEALLALEAIDLGDAFDQAELFYTLNRLNHDAVSVHPWRVTLLETDQLALRASFHPASIHAEALAQTLNEGFERARGLTALMQGLRTVERSGDVFLPGHTVRV